MLGEADAKLADKQVALAAAKAQLAAHDKHLLSQDATIKGLARKQVHVVLGLWCSPCQHMCMQQMLTLH